MKYYFSYVSFYLIYHQKDVNSFNIIHHKCNGAKVLHIFLLLLIYVLDCIAVLRSELCTLKRRERKRCYLPSQISIVAKKNITFPGLESTQFHTIANFISHV